MPALIHVRRNMAKEYAKDFYESEAWRSCRLGYIGHRRSVDGGMCEECGERQGYIVHHMEHITPQTINDPDITLSWDNLEYVCIQCHNIIHKLGKKYHFKKKNKNNRVIFDENGNPVERLPAPLLHI